MIDSIFIDLRLLQIPRSISTDTDISKSARVGCSHVEELNSQQNIFNVDRHFFSVWPAFHQTVAARSRSLRQVWRVWRRIKSGSLLLVPLYKCHKMISCAIHFVKLFTGNVSRWLRDCKLISLNYIKWPAAYKGQKGIYTFDITEDPWQQGGYIYMIYIWPIWPHCLLDCNDQSIDLDIERAGNDGNWAAARCSKMTF